LLFDYTIAIHVPREITFPENLPSCPFSLWRSVFRHGICSRRFSGEEGRLSHFADN
jgi:hypothetical protein